jgi:hypothetical protein
MQLVAMVENERRFVDRGKQDVGSLVVVENDWNQV